MKLPDFRHANLEVLIVAGSFSGGRKANKTRKAFRNAAARSDSADDDSSGLIGMEIARLLEAAGAASRLLVSEEVFGKGASSELKAAIRVFSTPDELKNFYRDELKVARPQIVFLAGTLLDSPAVSTSAEIPLLSSTIEKERCLLSEESRALNGESTIVHVGGLDRFESSDITELAERIIMRAYTEFRNAADARTFACTGVMSSFNIDDHRFIE